MFLPRQRPQGHGLRCKVWRLRRLRDSLVGDCGGSAQPLTSGWRERSALGSPAGHTHEHRSVSSPALDPMFLELLLTPGNSASKTLCNLSHRRFTPQIIDMFLTAHEEMKHFTATHNRRLTLNLSALRDQAVTQSTPEWFLLLLLSLFCTLKK